MAARVGGGAVHRIRDGGMQQSNPGARLFVAGVIAAGVLALALTLRLPLSRPGMFVLFLLLSTVAAGFKVTLPLSKGGSTLSASYPLDFAALLLFPCGETMVIAMASAWSQCTFLAKARNPIDRTLFSMSALALTVYAASLTYTALGGVPGTIVLTQLAAPLLGAALMYFIVNSVLIATAVALTARQSPGQVWHDNFLWSSPAYFFGAVTAATLAVIIDRVGLWLVPLAGLPIYLSFRAYKVYLGRIETEQRQVAQISELHERTIEALAMVRQSEQALAAEKERLAVTLRSIGDGVVTTDVDGRVASVNRAAELLTGWTQPDALGRPLSEVFPLVDRKTGAPYLDWLGRVLGTDSVIERDAQGALIRQGGERALLETSVAPIHDRDGHVIGAVLVFRDVTRAVLFEEEQTRATKLESLGILAGGIAHDFNNILTAVVGNVSLVREADGIDPASQRRLTEAERACDRAKSLTLQLLTFSKGGAPVKRATALAALIEDAATLATTGSNVRGDVSAPADLWLVEADGGQIAQAIHNVVINSMQAMTEGGIVRIRSQNMTGVAPVGLRSEGGWVRIAIEDEGHGIPRDILPKVFDPYFTTREKASGLGLATTYSIIKSHGGCVTLDSEVGVGTTVFIDLPRTVGVLPAVVPRGEPARPPRRAKVLVMDDEEMIRELAGEMLAHLGYEYDVASDGADAISRYRAAMAAGAPFDAVIMDLTIPGGMGGKEAIGTLLALDPATKAIVSSGYADDPVMADSAHYGFRGVMAKPYTVTELGRALDALLAEPAVPAHTCA